MFLKYCLLTRCFCETYLCLMTADSMLSSSFLAGCSFFEEEELFECYELFNGWFALSDVLNTFISG